MNWYDRIKELFTREVPETEIEAIFSRLDFDGFFNYLNNMWHPSELIKKMGGYGKLPLLYKDSEVYAAVDKRLAALLDTKLVFEEGDDTFRKFIEDQILPFEDQLKQDFWWSIAYGFGVEQIIYNEDRSGKVVGFQREEFYRFEPLPDLIHVKVINSSNPNTINKVLPYGKWVVTTNNGTHENPIGDAMFERLIMPYIFRCNGWDLWMDFAKRFANGFMHAAIEDEEKMIETRKALEKAGKSSVIVTDKQTDLNLIQASRDSSLYSLIDEKTSQTIQRVVLGETLSSSMLARGSSGAAGIHNEVRMEKTRADIRMVQRGIDEAVKQIAAVNGFTGQLPKSKIIFDPGLNEDLAARDSVLASSGVKFKKEYYVNNYGLKDEEFEIEENSGQQFPFSPKKKALHLSSAEMRDYLVGGGFDNHRCGSLSLSPNISRKDRRQLNEKEEVVDFLNRNSDPPLDPEDLISAILTAKSQSDLEGKLLSLMDQKNNSFVDTMTDALYYSASKGALLGNPEKLEDEDEEE